MTREEMNIRARKIMVQANNFTETLIARGNVTTAERGDLSMANKAASTANMVLRARSDDGATTFLRDAEEYLSYITPRG